jgi:uncharacterized cofD-like protein
MSRDHELVTLGTGTGQSVLIAGLVKRGLRPRAITGVTDNGGSSALVRRSLDLPQPGDTRSCLTAMAPPGPLRDLFSHRFDQGEIDGMSLGNLMLAALTRQLGGFDAAVARACELLETRGEILPVSDASTQIGARLSDGRLVTGEWEIIRREPRIPISDMFLEDREAPATPRALAALREARLVVLGPGTLRTGIVACLLFAGVREAIAASKARFVHVCNVMTQPGQTDGLSARSHVEVVEGALGRSLDHVLISSSRIPGPLLDHYRSMDAAPVEDDLDDARVIRAPLLQSTSLRIVESHRRPDNVFLLRHDPDRLAEQVHRLLERK